MDKYSFDTHSLVWYFQGKKTLSLKAFSCLEEVFSQKAMGHVSLIVVMEAYYISLKKKNGLNFKEFLKDLSRAKIELVPLDVVVARECFFLPKRLEMHDKIIVATAIMTDSVLVTKDRTIRSLKNIKTVW